MKKQRRKYNFPDSYLEPRRIYRTRKFVYALDDNDMTAWIVKGHIGRCKRYRIPQYVNIDDKTYTINSIEIGAYNLPRTLKHLVIPDTITYIDEDCLCSLSQLRSVYIGKGVEYLLNWNFRDCPHLSVIDIDKNNPHLKVMNGLLLTKDGTILVRELFSQKHIEIPEGVKYVEKVACWYDNKVESISFPSTLLEISDNSFAYLEELKQVVLPEGLNKLIVQCFSGCVNLEIVDLPSTLHHIGREVFRDCNNLMSLILRSNKIVQIDSNDFFPNCILYVPANLVESYQNCPIGNKFNKVLSLS